MTARSPSDRPSTRLERLLPYLAVDPANARLRADVFDAALTAGAFDEAQRQVVWALTRDPADLGWRHRLALLDMARGEWDEARALLLALHNEGQVDPSLEYNLAYVDFAQGRIDEAIARLAGLGDDALAEHPLALALMLTCQHYGDSPEVAMATFERLSDRVDAAPPFGAASVAALDAGNLTAAAAWAERSLARDGRQPEALMAKAAVLVANRQAAPALELLAVVFAQRPDDGRAISIAAAAELMSGRIAEARALFERGASLLPQQIPVWLGLGWTALFQQDLGGARSAFETALDLDPNSAESHGALAMVAAIEGRRDEALASIRRAVELDPDTWSIKFAQGVLDGQQADPQAILSSVQANSGKHATTDNRPSTVPIPSGRNVH